MPAPKFSNDGYPPCSFRTTLELMFERDRQQALAELRTKMSSVRAPVVSAGIDRQVLAVPPPLAGILPRGGLPRGAVVSLGGRSGATSLLLTLLAAPANAWSALVGMPEIGLLAAAELGVDLDRLVLIPDPGIDVLQILSVLADGVDIIVSVPPKALPPARIRVLTARLRQSGAVLLVTGQWPGADLVLNARIENWTGIGRGHGRLRDRELIVEVGGRGAAGRRGSAAMLLRSSRADVAVGVVPDRLLDAVAPLIAEVG